jgi:ribosomal protein L28
MVCAEALRTIDKHGGLTNAIMKAKEEKLSAKLQSVRNAVSKARRAK